MLLRPDMLSYFFNIFYKNKSPGFVGVFHSSLQLGLAVCESVLSVRTGFTKWNPYRATPEADWGVGKHSCSGHMGNLVLLHISPMIVSIVIKFQ